MIPLSALAISLALVMLASTIVHELGHVAAGWCFGYRVVGVRWLPPGVHLRGPRGAGAVAPPLEMAVIAACGPLATILSAWMVWQVVGPACAFLWACCGLWELAAPIPGSDGHQIITALFKAEVTQ